MGKVIELREHKVREFLRARIGRNRLNRLLEFIGNDSICDSFIYSVRSDLVFVEPWLLRRFTNSAEKELTTALDLVLDGLQRAPADVKILLTSDDEYDARQRLPR